MKLATLFALAALPLTGCLVGDETAPWEDGELPWSASMAVDQTTLGAVTPDITETVATEASERLVAYAGSELTTTSRVYDLNSGVGIGGASATLVRTPYTHKVSESTGQLPPGHVVALFYVVFNRPENCTHPFAPLSKCSEEDLMDPATQASILWADGKTASGSGKASFSATIGRGVGGAPGEVYFGNGMTNYAGAEVHALTRDKGLPIAGSTTQRTTFDGGCDVAVCANAQFAIFKAP